MGKKKSAKKRTTIYMNEDEFKLIKKNACVAHGGNVSLYLRSVGTKNGR